MEHNKENVMGMELEVWRHESCYAQFGVDYNAGWATLYLIESDKEGEGQASALLLAAKKYYEDQGLCFGGSVALNSCMRHIYKKLGIKEYSGGGYDL